MKRYNISSVGLLFLFLVTSLWLLPLKAREISGLIVDTQSVPVADVEIDIVGTDISVQTDDEGRYKITIPVDALQELHIHKSGFAHQTHVFDDMKTNELNVVLHVTALERLEVIGVPLHASTLETSIPVDVVGEEELKRKQGDTLGETLDAELGVHSNYFGPVVSSPVIRGQEGPRVVIAQNGMHAGDVSRVGPDHVATTESQVAEQIEIYRGPSALFYGSGAIGGVVNVVDQRVPDDADHRFYYQAALNTVSNERAVSFQHKGGTEQFAFYADGFFRESDDIRIPEPVDPDEPGDRLENSDAETQGGTLGASWLFEGGYIGLSYGRMDRINGIPGHAHGHEDEHEDEHDEETDHEAEEAHDEGVYSDLEQDRWLLKSEWALNAWGISELKSQLAYTDYLHREIEGNEVGTQFDNNQFQSRFEATLKPMSGWRGALLLDYRDSEFSATGEEAFTPPADESHLGFAFLEEKHFGPVLLQLGARIEKVSLSAAPFEVELGHHEEHEEAHDEHPDDEQAYEEHETLVFDDLDYTPVNLSAGVVWDFTEGYNLGLSYQFSQRAPSAQELFSFGPHIGTQRFEVGALFDLHQEEHDAFHFDLSHEKPELESSNNLDLTLRKLHGNVGWMVSVFYNRVDHYLYQQETGLYREEEQAHEDDHESEHDEHEEEDEHNHEAEGLPIVLTQAGDAEFYGLEGELAWKPVSNWTFTAWGDWIRAELDQGGDLPRTPPARLGLVAEADYNRWHAGFDWTHTFEQDKVAMNETATAAYSMLNANLEYRFPVQQAEAVVYLQGRNLTDEIARVHTSFLKDQTLLPGRGFKLGVRIQY